MRESFLKRLFFSATHTRICTFLEWSELLTKAPRQAPWIDHNNYRQEHAAGRYHHTFEQWKEEILNKNDYVSVRLTDPYPALDFDKELHSVAMSSRKADLTLENKNISRVTLTDGRHVTINNCNIDYLELRQQVTSLSISNSVIGQFHISESTATPLLVKDTAILDFGVGGQKPVSSGDVIFRGVFIPRHNRFRTVNLDALKRLRASLISSHNRLAASSLQSVELAHERKFERFPSRVISWIYEIGADYGNSTVRPLIWFLTSLLSVTLLGWLFASVEVGDSLTGWQTDLKSDNLLRAFIYAGQSIINPLGLFTSKSLVVAKSAWTLLLLTPLSLIGTLSIILFAISIRRRFKLEQ